MAKCREVSAERAAKERQERDGEVANERLAQTEMECANNFGAKCTLEYAFTPHSQEQEVALRAHTHVIIFHDSSHVIRDEM